MNTIIEDLNWRYATKKFDPTKTISDDDLHTIKESLRLTATSYGLQPLKFLIIESAEIRERLKVASFGQPQLTEASHIIVLCSYIDITEADIDQYMSNVASTRSIPLEEIAGYGNFVKQTISPLELDEKTAWNCKQAYIALGQVLHTCASLRIDSTPMEGFDSVAYDQILDLSSQNLNATLVFAIGYRHEDDEAQHRTKVRKSSDTIFQTI